jgi:hypothetical protein
VNNCVWLKVLYHYALRNKKRAEKKTEMEKKEVQA